MIDTGSPNSGSELASSLEQVCESGSTMLLALDDAVFFAPQGKWWSPAQHIRHLKESTAPVGVALKIPKTVLSLRFGTHKDPSRSFDQMRETYQATLAAGGRASGKYVPDPEPAPTDPATRRREIMDAWRNAANGVARGVRRWNEQALDRYQLPHPLIGALSIREMLAFTVYHNAHHLRRIAERAHLDQAK